MSTKGHTEWVGQLGEYVATLTETSNGYWNIYFSFSPTAGMRAAWYPTLHQAKRMAGAELKFVAKRRGIKGRPKWSSVLVAKEQES